MSSPVKGLISDSAESKISQGDDIFRTVFQKIQTGILIVDPAEHKIIDANPIAIALLGHTKEELLGNTCHEFVCPAKCGECPITDLHKDVHNMERVLINARGERIPILKTVAKAKINGKEYLIESFVDIIDRKKSEDRKVALIAFMNESVMRVHKPLELTRQNLQVLADRAKSGDYDAEDIRMQLQMHANNIARMVKTLEELSEQAIKERGIEIPDHLRDFFVGT
ncbi:PAS domain-containing protein [Methanoregula sp.]|uniref:PAS domain-containing protein n=1 Tax=Methanoregula sp. TaxID=2052170 RepID=UPI0035669383